jgi:hypothetical protein
MAVKMSMMVIRVVMLYGHVGGNQHSTENTDNYLQDHTASQPRRPPSTNFRTYKNIKK